jgi:hypothetical protein
VTRSGSPGAANRVPKGQNRSSLRRVNEAAGAVEAAREARSAIRVPMMARSPEASIEAAYATASDRHADCVSLAASREEFIYAVAI